MWSSFFGLTSAPLYEDGHLALVLPERQSAEELVHLALLQVSEPRRIFVARGMGGLLPEILKYPVVEVALAEPEATLAEMEIKATDPATRQALSDGRVHRITGDVRNLLRRAPAASTWDVVLLSTAEPSTLLAKSTAHQGELRRGPACAAAGRRPGLCPAWRPRTTTARIGSAQTGRCTRRWRLCSRMSWFHAAFDQLLFG